MPIILAPIISRLNSTIGFTHILCLKKILTFAQNLAILANGLRN